MLACMTGPRLTDFMLSSENQINVNMNEYLNKKYTAKRAMYDTTRLLYSNEFR